MGVPFDARSMVFVFECEDLSRSSSLVSLMSGGLGGLARSMAGMSMWMSEFDVGRRRVCSVDANFGSDVGWCFGGFVLMLLVEDVFVVGVGEIGLWKVSWE